MIDLPNDLADQNNPNPQTTQGYCEKKNYRISS